MTDLQILKSGESFTSEEFLNLFQANIPKMGFKTEGSERLFFAGLRYALDETTPMPFVAFEIGTATGLTTKSIQSFIISWHNDMRILSPYQTSLWKVISCDLPDGWSLNVDQLKKNLPDESYIDACPEGMPTATITAPNIERYGMNRVSIFLLPSERVLASDVVPHINFAFIDGCHCYQCVFKDFINVAKKLVQNGIIVFHDTGCSIQSPDNHSKHGKHMIYTRLAVEDIIKVFGDGFELLANLESDSNQNGMIIVRKR